MDHEQQHRVTIPQKFALARYALTFGEYDAYCAEAAVKQPDDEDWGRDRRPVINVSWGRGHGLLHLVERANGGRVSPAVRGGMGICLPR